MAFLADTQQGATFVITGLATFIDTTTNIPAVGTPIPVVDSSHLGTTGQRTCVPGDLADPDEYEVTHQHDGLSVMPTIGTVYTCTITMPLKTGDSVAEKYAGTCICLDTPSPEAGSDTPALQSVTTKWKPDGGQGSGSAWTRTIAS